VTAREQQIVRLWVDGVPAEEIAAVFGCASHEIRREVAGLRRQGVAIPLRKKQDRRQAGEGPRVGTPFEQMLAGTWLACEPDSKSSALQPAAQSGDRPDPEAPNARAFATALEAR